MGYVFSSVRHANIVAIKAVCLEPGRLMIVMELMKVRFNGLFYHTLYLMPLAFHQEGSLQDFLRKIDTKLPTVWPLLHRIAFDICSAMVYLHKHDRVHRDLKSGNVLVILKQKIFQRT